jgi:DNA gyrase subunit A
VVGDVIGKYHPHGDSAVYDSIVRMAQDFSMREPLVDGQGNFGSVDGDAAAAMRYTEIRMSRIAEELLADIDRDTVGFQPNYDDTLTEPVVLPARTPNLLVNGASGIAVGMSTNIPPHNLSEIVNVALLLIDRPDAGIAELMELAPAPDFPTGGFIYGREGIRQAYDTGRGIIQLRARATFEKVEKDRDAIIIHELPYQVNKARLIEKIAQLVHAKRLEGISDLRDESDRDGMRAVIELKRGEQPQIVLNNLYKLTPMQTSFGIILLALVDGQPRVLRLPEAVNHFLDHRKEVVRHRTKFDLEKAEKRAHILEGLKKALDELDNVIALIRKAKAPAEAREKLCQKFDFTDLQAQAILDMKLQRLTGLEQSKILEEYKGILLQIKQLKEILASERILKDVIKGELIEIQQKYQSPRRTVIVDEEVDITMEDLIPEEPTVITATHNGYIKRTALHTYKSQRRGGKGRIGMSTRTAEDIIDYLFVASTHSYILCFTSQGRVYWLKVYELPEVGSAGKGKPIANLIQLVPGEKISALISVQNFTQLGFVVMVSRKGYIKKTDLKAFSHPRSNGIIACAVAQGDELISVSLTEGDNDICLCSRAGKAIRFSEKKVRSMGRLARGVKGMTLKKDDELVSMDIIRDDSYGILAVTENGFGKRTAVSEYRQQGRGGQGVINIRTTKRNGPVVSAFAVRDDSEVIIITAKGKIIRLEAGRIRQTLSRGAQGVKLIDLGGNDQVAAMTHVPEEKEELDE